MQSKPIDPNKQDFFKIQVDGEEIKKSLYIKPSEKLVKVRGKITKDVKKEDFHFLQKDSDTNIVSKDSEVQTDLLFILREGKKFGVTTKDLQELKAALIFNEPEQIPAQKKEQIPEQEEIKEHYVLVGH